MQAFDYQQHTRVIFGEGALEQLGELARELNFRRTLLVADQGLVASGHVDEAIKPLQDAGVTVFPFHDFAVNPDTAMIERGRDVAAPIAVDSIIGLGGGSSLDCAKGINFLLTNGGAIKDYWGYGKTTLPMLPMIGVPTTAGTGSEAQSYALISDAETRVKMACGDRQAAFRVALLDPLLTLSQPAHVTATAGYDAIAHAIETLVTTKRNPLSETFSREAWRLLEANYERVLSHPHDTTARAQMQLGAYFAGFAIENSMLGAAHACANPLTRRYGTTHGAALAALLPAVVRWNGAAVEGRYRELLALSRHARHSAGSADLARCLEELATAGGLRVTLRALEIPSEDLPLLAEDAATQWTGRFNPRLFDAAGALEIYQRAF